LKRKLPMKWLAGGAAIFLVVLLTMMWSGAVSAAGPMHGHGAHGGFGYPGFPRGASPHVEHAAPWSLWLLSYGALTGLLKIGLIVAGAALWVKATGFLKWAGAFLGIAALCSLLSPIWAVLTLLVLGYFAYKIRSNKRTVFASTIPPSVPPSVPQPRTSDPGTFLDEWERRQLKEDN